MSNTNNSNNVNPNQLGALWRKESNGRTFYSGEITVPVDAQPGQKIQIVLFENDRKEVGSRAPDWRILKSVPREGATAPTQASAPVAQAPVPAPAPARRPQQRPARPAVPAPATAEQGSGTL